MSHKPVVSARQLMGLESKSENNDKREIHGIAANSHVTTKTVSQSGEKKNLTTGERIALKYGLTAASQIPSQNNVRDPRMIDSSSSLALSRYDTVDDSVTEREDITTGTEKRSFWDAQTSGLDTKDHLSSQLTYVSPFSDPNAFVNTKWRRQMQQQPILSQEEMKHARDTFYNDLSSGVQDVGARPRHLIGSAIPALDDAEEWISDAKESGLEDNEVANRLIIGKSKIRNINNSGQNKQEVRQSRKRLKIEQSGFVDGKEGFTGERWPQLDPPKIQAGPLVLSSSEHHGSRTFEVCASLNSYLLDYQRQGVEFLFKAYNCNTGAILGDDMGLGKTIQIIAFLSAIMGKQGDYRDKETWQKILLQRRKRFSDSGAVGHPEDSGFCFSDEISPIFIVMPASLLQNWEQELHTWMSCTTVILRGKPIDRDAIIDQIARGEFEIVICSYDILKTHSSRLNKISWEVVILDEMHCLKNPESKLTKAVKGIRCRKKLGLTGTLMQNNEKELHCLVDTIAPGAIGTWAEFSLYYGQDIKYGRKKSAAPEAVKRSRQKEIELRRKLSPYYLRREKGINPTFQVVKKCDQVVFCDLTQMQMAAYQRVLAMPEFQ
ncbi:putative P-loop containing nucleoside triphosphate hydrolase [Plasmopara halstedii]